MDQYDSRHLFRTLKRILKEQKISYRELASRVGCSEGTIKNVFHREEASLDRLFEISSAIGLPFPSLVGAAYSQTTREFSFSEEQERFLVAHPGHYNFFRELFFEKRSVLDVKRAHGLSDRSVRRYLSDLEKIGLLQRQARDRVTFLVSGRLQWRMGGPWMQKHFRGYVKDIVDDVLKHPESPDHLCSFSYATLSRANRDLFYLELRELIEKYKDVSYKEFLVPSDRETVPVTWVVGMIPRAVESHSREVPNVQ